MSPATPALAAAPSPAAAPSRSNVGPARWVESLVRAACPALGEGARATVRLPLMAAGFIPVSLIALTAFGVAGLRPLAILVLLPAVVAVALLALRHGEVRRLLVIAFTSGVLATVLYDTFRFGFLAAGLMRDDPIPHIGQALGLDPDWLVGYLWRYLGNGTGLALAFVAAGWRGLRAGLLYGLFVCGGLVLTLALAPYGQEMLFALNPVTLVMATGGHLIYGGALAVLADRLTAGRTRRGQLRAPIGPVLGRSAAVVQPRTYPVGVLRVRQGCHRSRLLSLAWATHERGGRWMVTCSGSPPPICASCTWR